ncbi:MAG: extracellular solute-binding protein [Anaerolineaceae bacterium]|nr:extracellular solute-binding protein [Anaerolineaceae bacterium]
MFHNRFNLIGIVLVASFILTACATPATQAPAPTTAAATTAPTTALPETAVPATVAPPPDTPAPNPVKITWWHIETADANKGLFQKLADEYTALHPNVTIEITVLENEAFKTKLTTVMQSSNPPDLFQSWGGGVMNAYAKAGLLTDITPVLDADGGAWRATFSPGALGVYASQGKNFGVPRDMGMVGFFYNKTMFTTAGIANPPTTWTEFLADITKLKAAGITPIALGEGDKWTGAFWWEYLAVRIGGKAAFDAAQSRTGAFTDPAFVEAGKKIQELVAAKPFQNGFLGATWVDEATLIGNGKAAMDLMGQWAPGAFNDNSVDKKGLGDKLGWFPFPMVEGGAGQATDALGGGNGWIVGKNAPPEAIDFLKFISSVDSNTQQARLGMAVPVIKGAEAGLTDPNLLTIQKNAAAAQYFQLYYDQYLPPAMGSVLNDSIQGLFAGSSTPEKAAQEIETSAKQELK